MYGGLWVAAGIATEFRAVNQTIAARVP